MIVDSCMAMEMRVKPQVGWQACCDNLKQVLVHF